MRLYIGHLIPSSTKIRISSFASSILVKFTHHLFYLGAPARLHPYPQHLSASRNNCAECIMHCKLNPAVPSGFTLQWPADTGHGTWMIPPFRGARGVKKKQTAGHLRCNPWRMPVRNILTNNNKALRVISLPQLFDLRAKINCSHFHQIP